MPAHDHQMQNIKRDDAIRYEQTRLLFSAMSTSVFGTFLGILFAVAVLWSVIDHAVLISWAIAFSLITLVRGMHAAAFKRLAPAPEAIHKWTTQFVVGSLAAGLCWGAAAIWLFPSEHVVFQMMLAFMLTSTCAIAITSLSSLRLPVVTFLLVALLPLATRFFMSGTEVGFVMGLMVSILIILLMVSALRIYSTTYANISLRLEALAREDELRRSQQHLTLHVQNTPLAVIEWNTALEVTNWNPAAEKMFGYPKEEALGKRAVDLIVPTESRERVEQDWQATLKNKGVQHGITENWTKDERKILCEWYKTPLIDESGEVVGIASLTQDITERKRMDELKNNFVSVVSHELRTPLTSIRGSLGLILGGAMGGIPQDAQKMLNIANNNTNRLLVLINDILDLEKIQSGKLDYHFENVEVMPLIEGAIHDASGYALEHEVTLVIRQPLANIHIYADPSRIMQVLNNLVSNAIKFSPTGADVEFSVTEQDHRVQISVSDHGPGIPKDFQPKLFDRFTMSDSSDSRGVGGTGLGLSIAKTIVEDHGGVISFVTEEGQGTTFSVEFPEIH